MLALLALGVLLAVGTQQVAGTTCNDITCLNGATCISVTTNALHSAPGEYAFCQCAAGYSGDSCETQLDPSCLTSPCTNNSTCSCTY